MKLLIRSIVCSWRKLRSMSPTRGPTLKLCSGCCTKCRGSISAHCSTEPAGPSLFRLPHAGSPSRAPRKDRNAYLLCMCFESAAMSLSPRRTQPVGPVSIGRHGRGGGDANTDLSCRRRPTVRAVRAPGRSSPSTKSAHGDPADAGDRRDSIRHSAAAASAELEVLTDQGDAVDVANAALAAGAASGPGRSGRRRRRRYPPTIGGSCSR